MTNQVQHQQNKQTPALKTFLKVRMCKIRLRNLLAKMRQPLQQVLCKSPTAIQCLKLPIQ